MAATTFPGVDPFYRPELDNDHDGIARESRKRDEPPLSSPADVGHEPTHWPVSTRCRRLTQAYVRLVPVRLDLLRQFAVHVGRHADPLPAVDVDSGDDGRLHWRCAHCGTSGLSLPECI